MIEGVAMGTVLSRVVLGILAALAVGSGTIPVVRAIAWFGADESIWSQNPFPEVATLAGMGAVVLYVARAAYGPLIWRIGIACTLAAFGYYLVREVIAPLVSEMTDATKGSEAIALEEGVVGFIWLAIGAYILWRVLSRRWPETQPLAPAGSTTSN